MDNNVKARDVWHAKLNGANGANGTTYYGEDPSANKNKRPFIIFACILLVILLLAGISRCSSGESFMNTSSDDISGAASIYDEHIGVLYIEGVIGSEDGAYNQAYILDAIQGMIDNDNNKGMMLYVNTPGGGVYESDEVYLKIKQYQEATSRPVYAYFASQATSGGYYVSASADKIIANRNCWTGSIGVTAGTILDISDLLEKHGIKTETITSGPNKAMGDITQPMTSQQKKIFQGLVDEAYDQFISVVVDGRHLPEDYVREIADGRIYTAKQAQKIKLIDDITNTCDEALVQMQSECGLGYCEVYELRYEPDYGLFEGFAKGMDKLTDALSDKGDISALNELMENNKEIPLQYICKEIK